MSEKIVWTIQRVILLGVLGVVDWFCSKPCTGDKELLPCKFTGTLGDWVGIVLLHLGVLAMMGLFKPLLNKVSPVGSSTGNYIIGAVLAVGLLLVWFA